MPDHFEIRELDIPGGEGGGEVANYEILLLDILESASILLLLPRSFLHINILPFSKWPLFGLEGNIYGMANAYKISIKIRSFQDLEM